MKYRVDMTKVKDRTVGMDKVIFEIKYQYKHFKSTLHEIKRRLSGPKSNYTGRYVFDRSSGKMVKFSNRANIKDFWFEKWRINGEQDRRDTYKSLEKRGKLGECDDRDVQRAVLKGERW